MDALALPPAPLGWREAGSGLLAPRRRRRYDRPTAIDLFCGAGGMSLGVMQAGFQVVAAADADPWATLTYLANLGAYPVDLHFVSPADAEGLETLLRKAWGVTKRGLTTAWTSGYNREAVIPGVPGVGAFWLGDIRKVRGADVLAAVGLERGEVTLVCGGPPCQGFSSAGKRDVMDPRNSLVFEFARLVIEIQPETILMENVPGIVNMVTPEGVPVLDALATVLQDGGIGTYEALKRSLAATAGAGAAVRGRRQSERAPRPTAAEPAAAQPALFEVVP